MKTHKASYASCLFFAFISLLGGAQEALAQEQSQERSVQFKTYLWSEPEGRVLTTGGERSIGDYIPLEMGFIGKDGQLHEFSMTARSFSRQQNYKGPTPLVFAVKQSGSAADAPAYRIVGQVVLPEGVDEALLFFFPQGNVTTGHYDISLLPSGPSDIPSGQALVVNLTGTPVAAKIGDRQVALQAGGSQKVSISGLERNRLPVAMGAQESSGEWRLRLERNISMSNNTALLLIFHEDNGIYRVESIRLRR